MNTKETIQKNLLTILGVLSIVLLFLPFAKVIVTAESQFAGVPDQTRSAKVSGFDAATDGIFGYLFILGPIALVAMNYVKAMGKYKGLLAIAVPAVCLITLVIVCIQVKTTLVKSVDFGIADAKIQYKLQIGVFLLAAAYLATAVAGAMEYHREALKNLNLEKIKNSGAELLGSVQEKVKRPHETHESTTTASTQSEALHTRPEKPAALGRKATNLSRVDEVLALIERLSKMKDAGVLTEEEYSEKKKQLLEEI